MAPSDQAVANFELAGLELTETFGFDDWRGVQEEVVKRLLLHEENTLVLMPTGGGKSLCYQVPAVILPGLTIVVSPLIALMKDQVDALRRKNVKAASMDSSLSADEMRDVRDQLRNKTLKLLYVAPERLNNESFIAMIRDLDIDLLAVDESHCVSEWGPSFRPDYLKVARFAKESGAKRVLCLTATATPSVVEDICSSAPGFNIDLEHGVFRTGNYRSNLSLQVIPCSSFVDKMNKLEPFLKSRQGGAAIVYATTQLDAENVAAELDRRGIENSFYHAGVQAEDRKSIQDDFMAKEGVVVATIAFGMGIDRANIRQVVHFMIPKTLENYSQEIGRAGRDGLPSTVLMLPCSTDLPTLESFARGNTPSRASIEEWLNEVFHAIPSKVDGSLDFSLYHQARDFDITQNTLTILYAILELDFGLLRAVTPFYSSFSIKPSEQWAKIVMKDSSPAGNAIRSHWKKGPIWCTIEAHIVSDRARIPREDIVRCLTRWEMSRGCESKVSGVRNRYMPLKKLLSSQQEIDDIAKKLHDQMSEREDADVKRLRMTADFVSRNGCYAAGLAEYFGDTKSVPNGQCGKCSWCQTRTSVSFASKKVPDLEVDQTKVQAILDKCGVRDDPRFLARLAFGISSPRMTTLGLSKSSVFRSMENSDFSKLVERFEAECAACGYKNKDPIAPPNNATSTNKRSAAGTGSARPFKRRSVADTSKSARAGGGGHRAKRSNR